MTAPALAIADPFSIIEDAIWSALESYAPLAALVKPGNRIKLTGSKVNPIESSSTSGDLPELNVWPGGANLRGGQSVPRTHDMRFWYQQYRIGVVTAHLRTNTPESLNVLKWHMFRALVRAEATLIAPAIPFCNSIEIGDFQDRLQDVNAAEKERGIRGWKGLLDVECRLQWSVAELRQ